MKDGIARLLKRKVVVQGTEVTDRTTEERTRLFDKFIARTENLPTRNGSADVVEMSETDDWKKKIPTNAKLAATSPFDELTSAEIKPGEVFGDPVVVVVDVIFGKVEFVFGTMEDMADDLKTLMSDRIRQRGRRIQDRSLEVRIDFFRKNCVDVQGIDEPFARSTAPKGKGPKLVDLVPLNWIASAVRPFERTEALTDDELGN
jgi:hypothetical protein